MPGPACVNICIVLSILVALQNHVNEERQRLRRQTSHARDRWVGPFPTHPALNAQHPLLSLLAMLRREGCL